METTHEAKTQKKGRKIAAIGLLGLGIAGMGLGAATQLNLLWNGKYQAGAVTVNADCQGEGEITVGFDKPVFISGQTIPWNIANVKFSDIHADCVGSNYEVAYNTGSGWSELGSGKVAGDAVTVSLSSVDDIQAIKEFALTIHS